MAEIREFDDRIETIEAISAKPVTYRRGARAAKTFSELLDAMITTLEPKDETAAAIYYSLIRSYLEERAADMDGYDYDYDEIG